MSAAHLSDDQIIEICLDLPGSVDAAAHIDGCPACTDRHAALWNLLTDTSDAASTSAAVAFSPEWLARQHARIMQRACGAGRPARVLAFPGQAPVHPVFARPSRVTRWVAAGVAAGLAVGLVTGHLVSRPRVGGAMPTAALDAAALDATPDDGAPSLRPIVASMSDDDFLDQLEIAVARGGPESLRPLDALTQRAWDVR